MASYCIYDKKYDLALSRAGISESDFSRIGWYDWRSEAENALAHLYATGKIPNLTDFEVRKVSF